MVTIILILITCLVSILCFIGALNANKLLFHAYSVWHRKEWYRMLTYGMPAGRRIAGTHARAATCPAEFIIFAEDSRSGRE